MCLLLRPNIIPIIYVKKTRPNQSTQLRKGNSVVEDTKLQKITVLTFTKFQLYHNTASMVLLVKLELCKG